MKHSRFYIMPAIMAALALSACGGKSSSPSLDFDRINVEKTVSIDNSKEAPQCHVVLDILQARNATNDAGRLINEALVEKIFGMEQLSLQAAADSFANTYTRDYHKNMSPLYQEDKNDKAKRAWYEYRYTVSTETRDGGNGITNYLIDIDYYEGGAHGIKQLLTMNFDNKTGRQVKLTDIFGANYEETLTKQLLEALLDKTGDKNIEALHQHGYLYSMDMFIPENYIIDEDKVTFIYNPYEIAPYSEGCIELDIKR